MTEVEARQAILGNGYRVVREHPRSVTVREGSRTWTGVSWRDLALAFRLHERRAEQ